MNLEVEKEKNRNRRKEKTGKEFQLFREKRTESSGSCFTDGASVGCCCGTWQKLPPLLLLLVLLWTRGYSVTDWSLTRTPQTNIRLSSSCSSSSSSFSSSYSPPPRSSFLSWCCVLSHFGGCCEGSSIRSAHWSSPSRSVASVASVAGGWPVRALRREYFKKYFEKVVFGG